MYRIDRQYWLLDLLVLGLLALVLRGYGLGELSFYYDEAENAITARSYLETGRFELPRGHVEPNGVLYKWLTAELFRWFGQSEYLARIPAAVCGVLVTIWLYLWGSHWLNPWCGRLAALAYAVWPWTVTWGRVGRFYNLQQLLFVYLVIRTWKWLEYNRLDRPLVTPLSASTYPGRGHEARSLGLLLVWLALAVLASFSSVLAVSFIPGYIFSRALWLRSQQPHNRFELRRSIGFLFVAAGFGVVVTGAVLWMDPRLIAHTWDNWLQKPLVPSYYLQFYRNTFGLWFVMMLAAGSVMAFRHGLAGLLLINAHWVPVLVHSLLMPHYRARFVYYVFPFALLLATLPLGWALQRIKQICSRRFMLTPGGLAKDLVAGVAIILSGWCLWNNLNAPRGTIAIVRGSPYTLAREVANWRDLSSEVTLHERSTIISGDPLLAVWYLGQIDYVYPCQGVEKWGYHPHTGTELICDEPTMRAVFRQSEQVWLIGGRRKFEADWQTPAGAAMWEKLRRSANQVWEGKLELMLLFENPSEVFD